MANNETAKPTTQEEFNFEASLGEKLFALIFQTRAANELGKNRVKTADFLARVEQKQKAWDEGLEKRIKVSLDGFVVSASLG